MSLIQALESYYRRTCDRKYELDDKYKETTYKTLVEAIPKTLDCSFKVRLKEYLKYGNEFSLRKRLKEILKDCGDTVNLLIDNHTSFISDVSDTRNFLTHYDRSLECKAKTGQELYILSQKTKFILEICFLKALEMSIETIHELASRRFQ